MLRNASSGPIFVFSALLSVCFAWPLMAQGDQTRDAFRRDAGANKTEIANQSPVKPSVSDFTPVLGKWCDADYGIEFKTVDAYHVRVDYPTGDWFKPTAKLLPPDPSRPGSKSFLLDFGIKGTMRLEVTASGELDSLGPGKGPHDSPHHTLHKC